MQKRRPLTSAPRGGERNQRILVTANVRLEVVVRQHLHLARRRRLLLGDDARLFGDECAQAVQVPPALVVLRFVALPIEPFEGREALNAEPRPERLFRIGVDLRDRDLVLPRFEAGGEFLVDGRQALAVAAPWREEFDKGGLAGVDDDVVEVVGACGGERSVCWRRRTTAGKVHLRRSTTAEAVAVLRAASEAAKTCAMRPMVTVLGCG